MAPDNPKWGYARIQVARSLVDEEGRALTGTRYLIIDRETKYTPRFRELGERRATKAIGRQPGSPDFRGFSSHSIPGGESGIRTHDTLLTYTHFPGVRLRPLGHLSVQRF